MRPILMSTTSPNIQKLFSQIEFEDSLQALQQLLGDSTPSNPETTPKQTSWDEVAEDIEAFLLRDFATDKTVLDYAD